MSGQRSVPEVALLGCGGWGRNLARNFAALGALTAVHDPDAEAVAAVAASTGARTRSLSEILDDPAIDGVIIAAPAARHAELAQTVLEAGKHVFVEKPLSLDVGEAEALIRLAKEKGRVLMVGHLLQYHPVFVRLKAMCADGELGALRYVYSNRLSLGKFRTEENALWSFAPHDISMIQALLGERVTEVSAVGHSFLGTALADVTHTNIRFAEGTAAHVFVSWLHPYKEQRLVVVGEKAMAVFNDGLDWPEKLMLFRHGITWQNGLPTANRAEGEAVPVEPAEPLSVECTHFLDCIRDGTTPRTDGREALGVLRILDAADRSIHLGRTIVMTAAETRYFAHETACIDDGVDVGDGSKLWHFVHVLSGSRIGRNCNIGQNVMIGPDVSVGDGCKIQNNVSVYKGVTLEDGVFCGPSMVFTNVLNPRAEIDRRGELLPTLVRKGASIGANATIVCGHTVGRYAFVAAGAVVTKDVPDFALVMGNPARVAGYVCVCGERLAEGDWQEAACGCGRHYARKGETVTLVEDDA